MRIGERIAERRKASGWSQTRLAREAGLSQPTIGKLEAGISSGSSHLHRIARVLGTTPAYLTGETDDPDQGAPPPTPIPAAQSLLLPVTLPSEDALAAAIQALLEVSRRMDEAELARELARRLPTLLRVAGDAFVAAPAVAQPARSEAA